MGFYVISKLALALISILFGILVLVFPGFLRIIIGAYFILMGLFALLAI